MQLKGKDMQLKVKDMQLKVSMQKNIEEKRIKRGYMFTLFYSSPEPRWFHLTIRT